MEEDVLDHSSSNESTILSERTYSPSLIELSKLPFLNNWEDISSNEQAIREENFKPKITLGLEATKAGDKEVARKLFLEAAQEGSALSMSFLGENLRAEGSIAGAFYWHRLAIVTASLKGQLKALYINKLKDISKAENCPDTIKQYIARFELEYTPNFIEEVNSVRDISKRVNQVSSYILFYACDYLLEFPIIENQYIALARLVNRPYLYSSVGRLYMERSRIDSTVSSSKLKEKAGEYFWKAPQDVTGRYYLAEMIKEGIVTKDIKNNKIDADKKYTVAANIYRKTIKSHYNMLKKHSKLYKKSEIALQDFKEHRSMLDSGPVTSEYYEVKRAVSSSLYMLGSLIENGLIYQDLNNHSFDKEKLPDVAARVYRKAGIPQAQARIALLVMAGLVSKDEWQKTRLALEDARTPSAYFILAILLSSSFDIKDRLAGLDYALKAAYQGFEYALEIYQELKKEIEEEQEARKNLSYVAKSSLKKKSSKNKKLSPSETKKDAEEATYSSPSISSYLTPAQSSQESSEEESKEPEITEKILTLLEEGKEKETLPLEVRKNLKELKKRQRSQDPEKKKAYKKKSKYQESLRDKAIKILSDSLPTSWDSEEDNRIYFNWSNKAKKQFSTLSEINQRKVTKLINDIRKGLPGAHEEPLRHLQGMPRRINEEDRLIYVKKNIGELEIISCKGHYED